MKGERVVAGVSCGEVLAELSDFLDGSATPERVGELKAHVEGCDVCEQFGDEFAAAISALRAVGDPGALPDDVSQRLGEALARELNSG